MFNKLENKSGIAIFEKNLKKDSLKREMLEVASTYWTDKLENSGVNQISY